MTISDINNTNNGAKSNISEIKLKAQAVARGVAIGKVVCLHGRKRQFYRISLEEPQIEKEIRRFRAALRLAKLQLKKISSTAEIDNKNSKSSIFEAHLLILDDRSFLEKIEKNIREQKVNAEWAVKIVSEVYIGSYKAIADEHLREKYIDLEDVAEKEPKNVQVRYNLARVHAMAYALKTDTCEVNTKQPNNGARPKVMMFLWFLGMTRL